MTVAFPEPATSKFPFRVTEEVVTPLAGSVAICTVLDASVDTDATVLKTPLDAMFSHVAHSQLAERGTPDTRTSSKRPLR